MRSLESTIRENNIESLEHVPHIYAESHESALHPEHNEDAFFVRRNQRAFGVFDGMGGEKSGEVASHLSSLYVEHEIQRIPNTVFPDVVATELSAILVETSEILSLAWRKRRQAIRRLSRALNTADDGTVLSEILQFSRGMRKTINEDPTQPNMITPTPFGYGTTALLAKEARDAEGRPYMVAASVSDSRLYVVHKDGSIDICTLDSAIGDRLIYGEDWELQRRLASIAHPTDFRSTGERTAFKDRHFLLQGLGIGFSEKDPSGPTLFHPVAPYVTTIDIKRGDIFLATSDGIHDNLTDKEIAEIVHANRSGNIAHALIVAAYDRSLDSTHIRHKPDDSTVVVYDTVGESSIPKSIDKTETPIEKILDAIRFAKSEKDLLRVLGVASHLPGDRPTEWYAALLLQERVEAFFHGTGTLDAIPNRLIRNKAESLIFARGRD